MGLFKLFGSDDMIMWTEEKRRKYASIYYRNSLFFSVSLASGILLFNTRLLEGQLRKIDWGIFLISSALFIFYQYKRKSMEK